MDDPILWLYVIIIVILIVGSAFFSSTETAFACINQFKLRVKADDGNKTARLVIKAYDKFNTFLVATLIGNNAVAVGLSTISTLLFSQYIFFELNIDETWISLITSVITAFVVFLFGDLIPKMIARMVPERVAINNVYIIYFFYYLLFPIVWLFKGITKLVEIIFKTKTIPTMTEEDFTNIVEQVEESGGLEANESDIIFASLDFNDTSVKEILTRKSKMHVIDLKGLTKEKLNSEILATNYSRIPVCYGDINKIVGILHVKTYIRDYLHNPNVSISSTLQKPYFVTTRIKMDDLIEGFKKSRTHIAIVKNNDEVVGMVTMEDVLEELVGNIAETNKETIDG